MGTIAPQTTNGIGQVRRTSVPVALCKFHLLSVLFKFLADSAHSGCGRCSIEGGTVELLYWPPATSSMGANVSVTGERKLVAATLGTTLTSPTLYVSYHSLYATDACGNKVGSSLFDKIIAIPPESTISQTRRSLCVFRSACAASHHFHGLFQHRRSARASADEYLQQSAMVCKLGTNSLPCVCRQSNSMSPQRVVQTNHQSSGEPFARAGSRMG